MVLTDQATSIFQFEVINIDGSNVSLDKYRGKAVLIVNIPYGEAADNKNFAQLQELQDKYRDRLAVLGFPCDQFSKHEPHGEEAIKDFFRKQGLTFDVFSKIDVNGANAHPLYVFLKSEKHGWFGDFVKWDYTKFLVNAEGKPVKRYAPTTQPKDIEKDIEELVLTPGVGQPAGQQVTQAAI